MLEAPRSDPPAAAHAGPRPTALRASGIVHKRECAYPPVSKLASGKVELLGIAEAEGRPSRPTAAPPRRGASFEHGLGSARWS